MRKLNQFLKFEPILKNKIWGGNKLKSILNKQTNGRDIGESWEISNIKKDISIVSSGFYKGKSLQFLINLYKEKLLGTNVYNAFGNNFPLLIKFIDANKALSLQVHPNDNIAREYNSTGKTEMWYIIDAKKESNIMLGFSKKMNKEKFSNILLQGKESDYINFFKVSKGDAFFVPAGHIHSIGPGVLLAEIQQSSDITYRVSDWNRKDSNGNYRDLHTELALNTIDYLNTINYKKNPNVLINNPSKIVKCEYFTVNLLKLETNYCVNYYQKDSFIIYMCLEGELCINSIDVPTYTKLKKGETVLIPSCIKEIEIKPKYKTKLLEIYI